MIGRMRDGWPDHYILVGRMPVAVDLETWAREFEDINKRRIARTKITDRCHVSTVFLGLDHNWHSGEPILFETMVFGGPLDQETLRYRTYDEAERGHATMVAAARKAVAQVGAIWKSAHRNRPSKGWRKHVRKVKALERAR